MINIYKCPHCIKEYKRKSTLEKHVFLCAISSKTSKEKQDYLEELENLPNHETMYKMIIDLQTRYLELEKKFKNINQQQIKQNNKIDVLDWLNTNIKPEHSYIDWYTTIDMNFQLLKYIFDKDFINGMALIFKDLYDKNNSIPIRCFDHKSKQLYVYDKDYRWKQLGDEDFIIMINTIHRKVVIQFNKWHSDNPEYTNDTNKSDVFHDNLIKVMGAKGDRDKSLRQIKIKIYNYLKFDLKSKIEFSA
jgi:hypothetical protein